MILIRHAEYAEIRLNRARKMNAINDALAGSFRDAVNAVIGEQSLPVIVISAEGANFMAGGDLAFLRNGDDRAAAARSILDPMNEALIALAETPQIVLASLKGNVAGAGMSLALGADLAMASSDTCLRLAYSSVGVSPDCGGTWHLPRLVGLRRAMQIALLPGQVDADEALKMGLLNFVVERELLDDETKNLALRLARGPGLALGATKALLRQAQTTGFSEQLTSETESFVKCVQSNDFAEGVDAFLEKRAPRFVKDHRS